MKMVITYEGTPKELADYTKSALSSLNQNNIEKIVKEEMKDYPIIVKGDYGQMSKNNYVHIIHDSENN